MSKTLKPCPFCNNGTAPRVEDENELRGCDCYNAIALCAVVCAANDGGCGASSGFCGTEEEAIAAWNRRADGWIPVTERLPEYNERIVVYKPPTPGYAESYEATRGYMTRIINRTRTEITHWMSLSEPPREEA